MPRTDPLTSTHKIHDFISDFGEHNDKVLMMRRLRQLRKHIQKEVAREFDHAIKSAKFTTDNLY